MNTLTRLIFCTPGALLACCAWTPVAAASDEPAEIRPVITVAVLDFDSKVEEPADLGSQLGSLVTAFLSQQQDLVTVEREELEKLLSEQELGLSGTVSTQTAAVVGQLTGAKVLVTGRAFVSEDELVIVMKVIGTETSRVVGDAVWMDLTGSVAETGQEVATRVAEIIAEYGDQLVGEVESRTDLVARLRDVVDGRTLPTVSITIHEQHVGRQTSDPAAETEVSHLLQELGFQVLDDARAASKADVRITGEAISEFALRRGNLISCQGRVEIEAVELESGRVVLSDRQTVMAVDLGEHMSAKAALQEAAAALVERLVPKLIGR